MHGNKIYSLSLSVIVIVIVKYELLLKFHSNVDGLVKERLTPLLMHWNYVFLVLSQQCVPKPPVAGTYANNMHNGTSNIIGLLGILTHWGLNWMVDILHKTFSNAFFKENLCIHFDSNFTYVVPKGSIICLSTLAKVIQCSLMPSGNKRYGVTGPQWVNGSSNMYSVKHLWTGLENNGS